MLSDPELMQLHRKSLPIAQCHVFSNLLCRADTMQLCSPLRKQEDGLDVPPYLLGVFVGENVRNCAAIAFLTFLRS